MIDTDVVWIFIGACVLSFTLGSSIKSCTIEGEAGYQDCVAELPRNKDCKLIAIPEE